jgi:hypothetical protein
MNNLMTLWVLVKQNTDYLQMLSKIWPNFSKISLLSICFIGQDFLSLLRYFVRYLVLKIQLGFAADVELHYNFTLQNSEKGGVLGVMYLSPDVLVSLQGSIHFDIAFFSASLDVKATVINSSLPMNFGTNLHTQKFCGSVDVVSHDIKGSI